MKTPTEAAEEYCDQPRCAQMTRDDKAWHRTKAAFLAGHRHALESEAVTELYKALVHACGVIESSYMKDAPCSIQQFERVIDVVAKIEKAKAGGA